MYMVAIEVNKESVRAGSCTFQFRRRISHEIKLPVVAAAELHFER
jgi:hypothetical protein